MTPLSLLFEPLELDSTWLLNLPLDVTYHSIYAHKDTFPDLDQVKIAIFSVDDNRGMDNHVLDALPIRMEFYKLKKSNSHYKIADLGTLRPGESYSDTMDRCREAVSFLRNENIIPILLNASHDVTLEVYKAMAILDQNKPINLALIDASLDIEVGIRADKNFVNQLIELPYLNLHRFKLMAYQSYLVNPNILSVFSRLSFEEMRLGAMKRDILAAEPMLRNSQIISMDMLALKSTEYMANGNQSVFGLSAEEACQICWYSGLSNSLEAFVFAGYLEELDLDNQSAKAHSVMLWYLIEGIHTKVQELIPQDSIAYIVENQSFNEPITFLKGKKTDKWWVKCGNDYLPCNYQDYKETLEGILPDFWLREVGLKG